MRAARFAAFRLLIPVGSGVPPPASVVVAVVQAVFMAAALPCSVVCSAVRSATSAALPVSAEVCAAVKCRAAAIMFNSRPASCAGEGGVLGVVVPLADARRPPNPPGPGPCANKAVAIKAGMIKSLSFIVLVVRLLRYVDGDLPWRFTHDQPIFSTAASILWGRFRTPSNRSPTRSKRAKALPKWNCSGRRRGVTSSQVRGVATGAPG